MASRFARMLLRGWTLIALFVSTIGLLAEPIPVPNNSFESPDTEFAFPQVDSWQRSPKPAWFEETPEQQWAFLTGVFENTAPGTVDYIGNMDGEQALFLFAYPEVAIFQDNQTIGGTNSAPTHEFDSKFEVGNQYELSVDVVGGGGGMKEGVALEIALYYRDVASNMVDVISRTITNSAATFPNQTNFIRFSISTPVVTTNATYSGQNIGIRISSVVDFASVGGYWDIDNVQLIATSHPTSSVPVPNFSFESPDTEFAFPQVDSWQRSPKPAWFPETPEQQWIFLTGVFENTAPGTADHIGNLNGEQALFLFAQPEVAIFQDYTTIGGTNSVPTMDFDAQYVPGRAYQLTAGIIGGGGGMVGGVTLELSLYYRDGNSNLVTVAAATVTNTTANFPNLTNLVDFHVMTPVVSASDSFQGKHIGIRISSTATFENAGGYWDVDNIRLSEVSTPAPRLSISRDDANLRVTWAALQGRSYQLQTSENFANWTNVGSVQNGIGKDATLELPIENAGAKFVRVVETAAP